MANSSAASTSPKSKDESLMQRIKNSRLIRFINESYYETRFKASWPTMKELRQFTTVVIVALLIVGLWIFGIDVVLQEITDYLNRL